MRQAVVGQSDPWVQQVEVKVPDATGDYHVITPASGRVVIYYYGSDGNRRYYNTSTGEFAAGAEVVNSTTVVGTESQLPYTHKQETKGRIVYFEGWILRNGQETPREIVPVQVLNQLAAKLNFK